MKGFDYLRLWVGCLALGVFRCEFDLSEEERFLLLLGVWFTLPFMMGFTRPAVGTN